MSMFEDMEGIARTIIPKKYTKEVKKEMAKDGITVVATLTEDDQTLILGVAMKTIIEDKDKPKTKE